MTIATRMRPANQKVRWSRRQGGATLKSSVPALAQNKPSLLKLNAMLQDLGLDLIVRNLKDIGPSLWFAIYQVVCPQDIKMPHHLSDKSYKQQIEHTKLLIGHLIHQHGDAAARHGLHRVDIKKLVDGELPSIRCIIDFYDDITTKQEGRTPHHRFICTRRLAALDNTLHQSDSDGYDSSHIIDGRGGSHGNIINEIHFYGDSPRQHYWACSTSESSPKTARKIGVADRLGRLFNFNFKKQKGHRGVSDAASEQDDSDFDGNEGKQGKDDESTRDAGHDAKVRPSQTSSMQTPKTQTHAGLRAASLNSHSQSIIATRSIGCQIENASSNDTITPRVDPPVGRECDGSRRSRTRDASQGTLQVDIAATIPQSPCGQVHAVASLIPDSLSSHHVQSPTKGIIREGFHAQGVSMPSVYDARKGKSPLAAISPSNHHHNHPVAATSSLNHHHNHPVAATSSNHHYVLSSGSIQSDGFTSTVFIDPAAMFQSTPRKMLFRVDNPDSRVVSELRHKAPESNVEAQNWTFSPANYPERPMFRFSDTEAESMDSLNHFSSIVSHDIKMLVNRQCLLLFDDYVRAIESRDEADLTHEQHYQTLIDIAQRHRHIVWQEPGARFQAWRQELYKRADYLNALFEYHDGQTRDKMKILYKYILEVDAEYVDWKANNEEDFLELREWNPGPEPQGPRRQQESATFSPPRRPQVSPPSSPPRSQRSSRQVLESSSYHLSQPRSQHSSRHVPSSSSNPLANVSFRSPRGGPSVEQAKSPKPRRRTISAPPFIERGRPRGRDPSSQTGYPRISEDDESSRDPALQSTPSLEHGTLRSNSSHSKATTWQSESQERRMARAIHQITQAALSNTSIDDPMQTQRRKHDQARPDEPDERLHAQFYSLRSRNSSYANLQGERRYALSD